MDLYTIVTRLQKYNIDQLVRAIDLDWFLDNSTGVMGITNARFLCNYIEDNIKKNTDTSPPLMHSPYIQDILQVHKLSFMKLGRPRFLEQKDLPAGTHKFYYGLIGRVDHEPITLKQFILNYDVYRQMIIHIFPDYKVEFDAYTVYNLFRLLGGLFSKFVDVFDIPFLYNNRQHISSITDYWSDTIDGPSLDDRFNNFSRTQIRLVGITLIWLNDLTNFSKLVKSCHLQNFPNPSTAAQDLWDKYMDVQMDVQDFETIKYYSTNLMAVMCSLGKLDFLKFVYKLPKRLQWAYTLSMPYGNTDITAISRYANNQYPNGKNSMAPGYFFPSNGDFRKVETYLGIALSNKHFDVANYILDAGYPIQQPGWNRYDVRLDIKINTEDEKIAEKYIQYVELNSRLILEFPIHYNLNMDVARDLISKGANPNVLFYEEGTYYRTILYWLVGNRDFDLAEEFIQAGADPNYVNGIGDNIASAITDVRSFEFCKKHGVSFDHINIYNQTPLMRALIRDLEVVKLIMNETTNLNLRDTSNNQSYLFGLSSSVNGDVVPLFKKFKLDIVNTEGLTAYDYMMLNNQRHPDRIDYMRDRGARGIIAYKKPMFYMLQDNKECPNEETVNLIETNNPENDFILAFRDMGYSDITFRHKQEPMCIAISEINEIYFKLRPNTDEFEWNLPTTRNTNRLGSDQAEDKRVIMDLISMLWRIIATLPDTDPRKEPLKENTRTLDANFNRYFKESIQYYNDNIVTFNSLNPTQLALLNNLLFMVFKLGMFMRRWGGDEEWTMKLYGKAEKFPYPMRLKGYNLVAMSDGTELDLLEGYNRHILIRSRDYPKDHPTGIVPYAEDMSSEQLAIIDHYINNYFNVGEFQKILNHQTNDIWNLLTYIRKESKIDLNLLLKEINPNLSIADILNHVENRHISPINLSTEEVYQHARMREQQAIPLEKLYKSIHEYTMHGNDIVSTGRRLYHTLDAIRPRTDGSIDEAALGNCIQLMNQDFILTVYEFLKTFESVTLLEGFDITMFRPMHY